jgi:hypothetical protein
MAKKLDMTTRYDVQQYLRKHRVKAEEEGWTYDDWFAAIKRDLGVEIKSDQTLLRTARAAHIQFKPRPRPYTPRTKPNPELLVDVCKALAEIMPLLDMEVPTPIAEAAGVEEQEPQPVK